MDLITLTACLFIMAGLSLYLVAYVDMEAWWLEASTATVIGGMLWVAVVVTIAARLYSSSP